MKNMQKVELSLAEINELIYALGVAQFKGQLVNKEVASKLEEKMRDVLDAEIKRMDAWEAYCKEMVEKDAIERELNTKWRVARWQKHCKDSWKKDVK